MDQRRPGVNLPCDDGRPDFAATPWAEFVGNDQYLNVLLSPTMGSLAYEALYLDDTILWDHVNGISASFPGAQVAFYEPGAPVIVDHAAAAGSGTSDAQSLHRIEPASVREEVQAAGFVLDAESTMLANKDDPHSIKVFDPSIKGKTDRFAYRFVKP
jgi:hypothetical protein